MHESGEEGRGRILVVDDSEFNRELLSQELEDAGYEVECAAGGRACLNAVAVGSFDLVVLDIMMPDVSGLDVLSELRQTYTRTELPVIMATAKTRPESMVEALGLGANDYVTKPIDISVLLARLQVLVDVRRQSKPQGRSVFRTLSDKASTSPAVADTYCKHCFTVATSSTDACPTCFASRPAAGWTPIPRETLGYLGRTIGQRYYLDRHLGQGGGGEVYRALELDIERHFVAKLLSIGGVGTRQGEFLLAQVRREVSTLAKLKNPHVVQIFEMVQLDEGHFAVIMEYMDGFDVAGALRKHGALPAPLALDVVRQVALGLHAVHELGLIHCDIKPRNVMLQAMPGQKFFAKLVDFGIAKSADDHGDASHFVGTPRYCAPEQFFREQPIDGRADIYALGLVLHEIVSDRAPFVGPDLEAFMREKRAGAVPSLRAIFGVNPLSELLDGLVAKMSDPEPQQRFSTVMEVIDAIDLAAKSEALHTHRLGVLASESSAWEDPTMPVNRGPV